MHGSDRVPDLRDYNRAWVGKGKPFNQSEMALSPSARWSVREKCLTPPTLSETRCYNSNRRRTPDQTASGQTKVRRTLSARIRTRTNVDLGEL
jgi:hypothetical protein